MIRSANWSQQLADAIERWRARPRVFGSTDCCQFVGDVVLSMTGEDPRASFPSYTNEAGAAEILAAHGGMVGLLDAAFGEHKHVAWAKVGDVVAHNGTEAIGESAGICVGVMTATITQAGLVFIPTLDGVAAWSI